MEHTNIDLKKNEFGVTSLLYTGFQPSVERRTAGSQHPLEQSESTYRIEQRQQQLATLRNLQGVHAPLRLAMEERIVERNSRRLPGLSSSHLMRDILTGRIDEIGFEDYLNDPSEAETIGQPHMMAEKQMGLF